MKDRILNALLLLTVAAALGLSLWRGGPAPQDQPLNALPLVTAAPAVPPVEQYRAQRKEERAQERAMLSSMMENSAASPETRALAEAQWGEIAHRNEVELAVEAALAAKGLAPALCVCRGDALTIFVPRVLTKAESSLLLDWAAEVSGAKRENIRISVC